MNALRVSDQALIRFLELGGGMDVETLRCQLAASLQRAQSAAASIGGGEFLILSGGLVYVCRNHQVTTIIPEHKTSIHTRARLLAPR